jgi:hypothetical protein
MSKKEITPPDERSFYIFGTFVRTRLSSLIRHKYYDYLFIVVISSNLVLLAFDTPLQRNVDVEFK